MSSSHAVEYTGELHQSVYIAPVVVPVVAHWCIVYASNAVHVVTPEAHDQKMLSYIWRRAQ
jgi:predicted 2-oxoglutarate/Fe(II)-dependent dioxygenase YbiX